MKGLTSNELRLVEEYLWMLDFVSRCALGSQDPSGGDAA